MSANPKDSAMQWVVNETTMLQDCRVFTVDKISCTRAPSPSSLAPSTALTSAAVDGGDARQFSSTNPAELPDQSHDFFVMNCPDFVNVVALTSDGLCVLVEQWRHGSQELTLEIPGGLVDAGESAETAARRELLEETGFEAAEWIKIGVCRPNAAIQSNHCTTFLALDARLVAAPSFDAHEHCVVHTLPWPEVVARVRDGRIDHALVVAAVLYARLQLAAP